MVLYLLNILIYGIVYDNNNGFNYKYNVEGAVGEVIICMVRVYIFYFFVTK